jgi:ElaB/YqjD/DUF883 family membrane-anchored ribosome-binding protein
MTKTENLGESAQDAADDLSSLRADIAQLTDSVTTLVKAQVDFARQKLSDGASDAKNRLSDASSTLEASIERNPLIAVLIALGAGLVIGLLSRGRQ